MRQSSDLPFGSEFSPSQVDLSTLLQLVADHEGDVAGMQEAILNRFFAEHGNGEEKNRRTLAMNCRLGMKAYGIIDDETRLTEFGHSLLAIVDDKDALYESLARHILLNLKGMALTQCIRDMTAAGEDVNLTSLRKGLADRGIHYPAGGKHPSMMRLWLAKAGVFSGNRWQINEVRVEEILGLRVDEFAFLSDLTQAQRAFLMTMANIGREEAFPANEVAKLASATFGVEFPEKSLPKVVLEPLADAGFITMTKTTEGRGAKPFLVKQTQKLETDIVIPLLEQLSNQTDPKLIALLRKPLTEIMEEIDSADRYIGGLALEALAFKLMRLLNMEYVATRLRAQSTGGAEVDLVFQSARLVFSRWQVQCKNTSHVSLDDVAKEVGLTHFLKSNVVVVVSTGVIGSQARRYANRVMNDSNLCIVMIDKADLDTIRHSPAVIVDVFQREASHAMTIKRLDI